MELHGRSIIGGEPSRRGKASFSALAPASGQALSPPFYQVTDEEIDRAMALATQAFEVYRAQPPEQIAAFLDCIAEQIVSLGQALIERASLETALPEGRLIGERARTVNQLKMFAELVREGSGVEARIDRAMPARQPLPKPDLRNMLIPIGPVVVFGASNFPLAFSVAGGDTASALAAGNAVVVKAHPGHPGTSELVGRAVQASVRECGLPEGVFSLLFGSGSQIGTALMKHPLVRAGGFTGSRLAGRILMDVAASRPEPIPFYAEMSSTNPVFILPGALRERGEKIAAGLHTSFTMGAGQFCTKPGMVFLPQGDEAATFADKLRQLVAGSAPFHLLTRSIYSSYDSALAGRKTNTAVRLVAEAPKAAPACGFAVGAALFETDADTFLSSDLDAEIFGPTTLLVRHSKRDQILEIASSLEGHLTATIHGTAQDLHDFADLISILEGKVGRLVFNGFPTGVEVCHAMVHGGPYPSTSDGRSTSVGTRALFRFTRPVCYQGFPDEALPQELKDANPLGIWRMVDGQMTREATRPALSIQR